MSHFKNNSNFNSRLNTTTKIKEKYPEKVPIYVSFDKNIEIAEPIEEQYNRYIVTSTLSLIQFIAIVRKKIKVASNEALTFFIEIYKNDKLKETVLVPASTTISEVYGKYKDTDGFLYIRAVKENVFG